MRKLFSPMDATLESLTCVCSNRAPTLTRQTFLVRSYGHVDAEFRENMTKEEAQQFVRKAISHAMARDGSSGGVIRMVVIDKAGVSTTVHYFEGNLTKSSFGTNRARSTLCSVGKR